MPTFIENFTKIYLNPGIYTLLEYLKNNHYKIALASSSSIQLVNQAISSAYLKHYFDLITSGNFLILNFYDIVYFFIINYS